MPRKERNVRLAALNRSSAVRVRALARWTCVDPLARIIEVPARGVGGRATGRAAGLAYIQLLYATLYGSKAVRVV